jgi:hypothetical protein
MKTRTEITLEMDRVIAIWRGRSNEHWCAYCQQIVKMFNVDQAALKAGVSSRTVFHWVEAGRVHSTETAEGLLLICPDSLS